MIEVTELRSLDAMTTAGQIVARDFRTSFRGYHPSEVRAFLVGVSEQLASVEKERDRLAARLEEIGPRDLQAEIESVSREVGAVLETARQAAESMRERATIDQTQWRAEAMAEVDGELRRARADAEQLRGDAWVTAEQLLSQCRQEADQIRDEARQNSLRIMGQAEVETHRLVSGARRESDELVRAARMESERLAAEARLRHDELIETAQHQSQVAQERTRGLEDRRSELMREIESVRASLSGMEADIKQRRGEIEAGPPPAAEEPAGLGHWQLGETVRVIRPEREKPARPTSVPIPIEPAFRLVSAAELSRRGEPEAESQPVEPEPEPELEPRAAARAITEPEPDAAGPATPEPTPEPAPEPVADVEVAPPREVAAFLPPPPGPDRSSDDEVAGLFNRLRRFGQPATKNPVVEPDRPVPEPAPPSPDVSDPAVRPPTADEDFARRDRLLLPVGNRALRDLKSRLVEEQNRSLDGLRVDPAGWTPSSQEMSELVRTDLVVLVEESFGAGHAAAVELIGEEVPRLPTPKGELAEGFAEALVADLTRALSEARVAEHGSRPIAGEVSRVFRVWRTDETERRVRHLSAAAYHQGLSRTLEQTDDHTLRWVLGGRGCATCRASATGAGVSLLPPAHVDCQCTLGLGDLDLGNSGLAST